MPQSISTDETNTTSKSHHPKDQRPLIIGMVVCAVLAIAGIGFGAYGIINSNSKSDEISQLKVEIKNKDQKLASFETDGLTLSDDGTTVEITDSALAQTNPVLSAPDASELYTFSYTSPEYLVDGSVRYAVKLNVQNGDLTSCDIVRNGETFTNACSVSGVNGKIYKITFAGEGQAISDPDIALIMQDGTVQHIHASQVVNNANAAIEGTYAIDGSVVDAVDVTVSGANGGYGTTLFILADGSFIPYGQISQ